MTTTTTTLLLLLLFSVFTYGTLSQQPYEVNNPQLDCYNASKTTSVLGYTCNAAPSCPTFFTFRSQPPYQTPSTISALLNSTALNTYALNNASSPSSPFPINDLLLIPSTCSCVNSSLYQHTASYTIKSQGENYLLIANNTYQGLSTCQALIAQNPIDSRHLTTGDRLTVPLRCACPTPNQARNGINYLLSYLVTWGDDVPTIAQRFRSDFQAVLDANSLSSDEVIYPFTTLLVPIKTVPSKDELLTPPPPAPSPKPGNATPAPADGDTGDGSGWKWVFIGVGIGAGFVILGAALAWYYFCCSRRRDRKLLDEMPAQQGKNVVVSSSIEYGALSGKASTDPFVSSEIRGFMEALTVYRFGDLEKATGFFGEDHRIKGAVYRAVINGDDAAIKRLKGDVTNEIKILKQINHSNVVRLSGFCVHEGNTYLVYEFAEKGSLADWLHHNKDSVLSWKHRVRVAYDVADGLNYLHNYTSPPYIHKNLKSSNILLDGEFRAKLANFGLARPMEDDDDEGPQLTRHVVGTQGYMAPEYLEHGLITPKLDVFAFGVIVLELLSGKEATFAKDGEEKGEVLLWAWIQKVMRGEDVRSMLKDFIDPCLREGYPFDLAFAMAELAMRCVATDPGSRPAMTEVMMSLSAIYSSSLDYDPSDIGNTGSMIHGR